MPDPAIDPTTGEPAPVAPQSVSVPAEEWAAVKAKLDVFEKLGPMLGDRQAPAPAAPRGPTLADQVKEIDGQIEGLNAQIDDAISDGKGVSALLTKRDNLTHKRTRLLIKAEDIDPAISSGISTIEQLSSEVTRGKMPYFDIVRDDYEAAMRNLPPEQRMSPTAQTEIYNYAVGKNITKIQEVEKEKILRESAPPQGGAPPAGGGRAPEGGGDGDIPKPKDVLSEGALSAIKRRGLSVDEYYKGMGYKGGFGDWWTKVGKAYHEEEA